ncbi:MAG TPA: UDPGP type 1 family protein [Candidatus Coproplasma excrementipullorum]|nr:UDPGP type 1 family protein [Candidatus Coproplasma excrementipullorum]
MNYTQAEELLAAHGQMQLLDYYDELTDEQRACLLSDIAKLDFSVLENLHSDYSKTLGKLSPADALSVDEVERNRAGFEEVGLEALRAGKVAAVLLAGGQGTRLGSSLPKGMFNIGVTRRLTIFEQQMNNIKEVTDRAGCMFHLFVMTSDLNDKATRAYFAENNYFGYDSSKIHFYEQKLAPTCSKEGKIYLDEKYKVSQSPNGNGGWYSSLIEGGYGPLLESEGIEWLNIYAVDNVLQRICDPVFIGATLKSGCACSSKVVSKISPEERVGVLCKEDGKPSIVEYYEMPKELASLRDADGRLTYRYGVILNYLFSVKTLNKIYKDKLPCHLAFKAIPHIEKGVKVIPTEPCGYKFETLAVDIVRLMGSCLAVEVVRENEFAPVKNKTGVDSVESARELLAFNGVKL